MSLLQEGPINTLVLNKECNKVVVTGRNSKIRCRMFNNHLNIFCVIVFRICEIRDSGFVERDNIRTGKNSNLNFSCNDASWNPVDGKLLIFAASVLS